MRYFILAALLGYFLGGQTVIAQTDEFTIRALVGDDLTSPSNPDILSVIPITATQIDIEWSTSTDNWIFGGYVLLRDGTPIATTTQTSYNDTGLTPETEYAYSVYAFDAAGNLSSTSNEVATTTLAIPVAPTSTPPVTTEGDITSTLTVVLRDLAVIPGGTSAFVRWSTNIPTRFTFRWGRTDAYTGGYISNEIYAKSQATEIQGLEPGTVYLYELIGYSPAGIAVSLRKGQFTTTAEVPNRVVANVERLTVEVVGADATLRYAFPAGEEGARVRVVRSHLGFPVDPFDGAIVYEGSNTTVVDRDALAIYGTQYYTVFVIGRDGTISSGAVVLAQRFAGEGQPPARDGEVIATTSLPIDLAKPEITLPLLDQNDIVVIQANRTYTFLSEGIELSPHQSFTISIGTEALPRHLKSIIVTLLDPTDQRRSYSFLLRINKAGVAYEATIAPLQVFGVSRLQVEVYDFDAQVVGRYRAQLNFVPGLREDSVVVFPDAFIQPFTLIAPFVFGIGLILLLLWLLMWWRRRSPEDKT